MRENRDSHSRNQRHEPQYALRRELGFWQVIYEGRPAIFKHELGALYVAYLLLNPPPEPIHAVALALKARDLAGATPDVSDVLQQRSMGLEDAETARALWRRQRALEAVLEDEQQIEPVKAEALRELEEVTEFLRKSPWRCRDSAERCVRAVARAIHRLHVRLARAVDAQGQPHPVLEDFAWHLHEFLLVPSGRGNGPGGARRTSALAGCFTYEPPPGVVWVR
jgi:hypothetical protein